MKNTFKLKWYSLHVTVEGQNDGDVLSVAAAALKMARQLDYPENPEVEVNILDKVQLRKAHKAKILQKVYPLPT